MVSRGAVVVALLAVAITLATAQEDPPRDPAERDPWVHTQVLGPPEAVTLTIAEGPELTPVDLGEPTVEAQSATWRTPGMTVIRIVTPRENMFARDIELSFRNDGDAQRLLDVTCSIPAMVDDARWWDGRVDRAPASAEFLRNDSLRAPISAALVGQAGMALALNPECLLSTFAIGASGDDAVDALSFRTRIVLDQGQTLTLPLVQYAFVGVGGYRTAVQAWYELFPQYFSVNPGTRPSLIGGGGYLFSGRPTRELQWEEARRLGMGWEWAYCPAQTPGDWYPDERFYDPEKGYAGDMDRHRNEVKGSLDDYRRDMRERFQRGWWRTSNAYYLLPHAADISVLERFPDGAIIGPTGEPTNIKVGWIKTDAQTRMSYPWGNAYGQEVAADIEQIASDFGAAAIGFDEAYGADRQYGAGIEDEPARAWDDEGRVYASTQVALSRLAEHIHEQTVRGYTMGMVMNKPTNYQTATRTDVAMHEFVPWMNTEAIEPMRLLLGHKPMSWWSPPRPETILNWQEISPEEIREGIKGLHDYIRLASLRWGAFPMNMQLWGVEELMEVVRVLREMLTEGWQADPAFTTDERLWTARYGRGAGAFLVAGNPTREAVATEIRPLMEGATTLYCAYDGSDRSVQTDEITGQPSITLELGPKQHEILRTAVRIGLALSGSGTASMELHGLTEGTLKANWTCSPQTRSGEGAIAARVPRGATVTSFVLNGEEREFEAFDGEVRWEGVLPREGSLRVRWTPAVVVEATREQIADFPFVEGDALATIVLPSDPSERDRYLAEHLSVYFDYWQRRQEKPEVQVSSLAEVEPGPRLPIAENAADIAGPRIVLAQAQRPAVQIVEDTLIIGGRDDLEREKAMLRLMGLMDEHYPHSGAFPDHPMYAKAGMVGRTLEAAIRDAGGTH